MEKTAMQKHLEWLKGRMVVSPQMESQLLEEEKQQIIEAYIRKLAIEDGVFTAIGKAIEYYNQKFKQD